MLRNVLRIVDGGQQQRSQCVLHLAGGISQCRSQIALRVVVNEQDFLPFGGQRGAKVQGRRCFANATLGICNGNNHHFSSCIYSDLRGVSQGVFYGNLP